MGSVGAPEILVILFIALLVLGPERLPGAARSVGKAVGEFRRVTGGIQAEMRDAVDGIINPSDPEPAPSTSTTAIPTVTVDAPPVVEPPAPLAGDDPLPADAAGPAGADGPGPADDARPETADPGLPMVGTTGPAGGANPVAGTGPLPPFDPSLN
jgi:sec-independent protein translocase protein TatB